MTEHSVRLLEVLDVKLERTYAMAPKRTKSYKLLRRERAQPHRNSQEHLLEMAIWTQWGWEAVKGKGSAFSKATCHYIQAFQMPLRAAQSDSWGPLDLVGVSYSHTPVVLELKRGKAKDTPLRMLVEGLAYAVALRRAWNEGNLRNEWLKCEQLGSNTASMPETLLTVPIVGIAPTEFWNRNIGVKGKRSEGKVPDSAWAPFRKLCEACNERGFPVSFLEFTVGGSDETGLPTVDGIDTPKLPW